MFTYFAENLEGKEKEIAEYFLSKIDKIFTALVHSEMAKPDVIDSIKSRGLSSIFFEKLMSKVDPENLEIIEGKNYDWLIKECKIIVKMIHGDAFPRNKKRGTGTILPTNIVFKNIIHSNKNNAEKVHRTVFDYSCIISIKDGCGIYFLKKEKILELLSKGYGYENYGGQMTFRTESKKDCFCYFEINEEEYKELCGKFNNIPFLVKRKAWENGIDKIVDQLLKDAC